MSDDVVQAAQAFLLEFRKSKDDILTRLAEVTPGGADLIALANVKADITALGKRVTEATLFLPGYDQRQFALQLKELQDAAAKAQAPRAKFSFKNKRSTKSTAAVVVNDADAPVVAVTAAAAAADPQQASDASRQPQTQTQQHIQRPPGSRAFVDITDRLVIDPTNADAKPDGDIFITQVHGAVIDLRRAPVAGAVHMQDVTECAIMLPIVNGSILADRCSRCMIVVPGCRQCRIHNSNNTIWYIHVASRPIIEDCTGMAFAPCESGVVDDFEARMQAAGLDAARNEWMNVDDFNWLRAQASPNWKMLAPEQRLGADAWPSALALCDRQRLLAPILHHNS